MSDQSNKRTHWSNNERCAVETAYNCTNTAEEFFEKLDELLGPVYRHRTVKAYLTYLNEVLPRLTPRKPVYQSLLDANQVELRVKKATAKDADLWHTIISEGYKLATSLTEHNRTSDMLVRYITASQLDIDAAPPEAREVLRLELNALSAKLDALRAESLDRVTKAQVSYDDELVSEAAESKAPSTTPSVTSPPLFEQAPAPTPSRTSLFRDPLLPVRVEVKASVPEVEASGTEVKAPAPRLMTLAEALAKREADIRAARPVKVAEPPVKVAEPPVKAVEPPVKAAPLSADEAGDAPMGIVRDVAYTLEALRMGIICMDQAKTILGADPNNHHTHWALTLLSEQKITVVQCQNLMSMGTQVTV